MIWPLNVVFVSHCLILSDILSKFRYFTKCGNFDVPIVQWTVEREAMNHSSFGYIFWMESEVFDEFDLRSCLDIVFDFHFIMDFLLFSVAWNDIYLWRYLIKNHTNVDSFLFFLYFHVVFYKTAELWCWIKKIILNVVTEYCDWNILAFLNT
jgi:hypothetical protein